MSASFTIHLPKDAVPGDARALERAEIVRDGFSWTAFFFPVLWFLWHRHWLVAALALAGTVGLPIALAALRIPGAAILAIEVLVHLFLGLEASSIRRFAYRLRRRPMTGLVVAADAAEAETKSFAQWLAPGSHGGPAHHHDTAPAPVRVTASARPLGREPVLGLFPDFEGRR
jgi:hypothetical protein